MQCDFVSVMFGVIFLEVDLQLCFMYIIIMCFGILSQLKFLLKLLKFISLCAMLLREELCVTELAHVLCLLSEVC